MRRFASQLDRATRARPSKHGIFPGWAGAGVTSTRSCVISSSAHELAPSRNTSPARDSKTTLVEFAHPHRLSLCARNNSVQALVGMVPPLNMAIRREPARALISRSRGSQVIRGRSSENSSEGIAPGEHHPARPRTDARGKSREWGRAAAQREMGSAVSGAKPRTMATTCCGQDVEGILG